MGHKLIWGEACTPNRIITSSGLTPPSLLPFDISGRAGILRKLLANVSYAFGLGVPDFPSGKWWEGRRVWKSGGRGAKPLTEMRCLLSSVVP